MSCDRLSRATEALAARVDAAHKGSNAVFVHSLRITQVNERLLKSLDPIQLDVSIRQVEDAEMDEMWSFVGSKKQQRWLWHAIDHQTGDILAFHYRTLGQGILK